MAIFKDLMMGLIKASRVVALIGVLGSSMAIRADTTSMTETVTDKSSAIAASSVTTSRPSSSTTADTASVTVTDSASSNWVTTTILSNFDEPKYPPDFTHFDYVNPDAPKGGEITLSAIGTYDSFNRFAQRGNSASGSGEIYDTLFVASLDEIESFYPLIAKEARHTKDYQEMIVTLNPAARFSDGKAITAEDVVFSFDKFMREGVPQYRRTYADVETVEALDEHTVRFKLLAPNRSLMIDLVTGLRILPAHYWADRDLSEPLDEPPVTSGAYKIGDYQMGKSITYVRDQNYWARDLPSQVGMYNFDQITYDYYKDANVALEAFKRGEFDFNREASSKNWAELYNGDNFDQGYIVKSMIADKGPQPYSGFVFNTQRAIFADIRVREALSTVFDFQWLNRTLFYDAYQRNNSYFQGTQYAAQGLPSEAELVYLDPLRDQIPERVFTKVFSPTVTDGSGNIRPQMRKALSLFEEAGWSLQDGVMQKDGRPFEFEIIVYSPTIERIAIPVAENFERLGIKVNIQMIDTSQYLKRLRDRDFDMLFHSVSPMAYPSRNIRIGFHSDFIDSTYNTPGIDNPAVDQLVDQIAKYQDDPEKLAVLGPALDRVLTWNYYQIPGWYFGYYRVAYWDKFSQPEIVPTYSLGFDTWWYDADKAATLPADRR